MEQFLLNNQWLIIALGLWTLPWKGVDYAKEARLSEHPVAFQIRPPGQ